MLKMFVANYINHDRTAIVEYIDGRNRSQGRTKISRKCLPKDVRPGDRIEIIKYDELKEKK